MVRKKPPPRLCDAPGCAVEVRIGILMCRPHWFQLPRPLRDAINQSWAGGQIRAWSAHCLEARAYLNSKSAATRADRITGDRP